MTVVHRSGPSNVASDVRSYEQRGCEKDLMVRRNEFCKAVTNDVIHSTARLLTTTTSILPSSASPS